MVRGDGPFTDAKEMVGGYAVLELGSTAEAAAMDGNTTFSRRSHVVDEDLASDCPKPESPCACLGHSGASSHVV